MTQISVFLDAETASLAPGEGLVVPEAARVEADVAANRAHVAQHGRSHGGGCLGQDGIMLAKKTGSLDFAQCGQRADLDASIAQRPNAPQLTHSA